MQLGWRVALQGPGERESNTARASLATSWWELSPPLICLSTPTATPLDCARADPLCSAGRSHICLGVLPFRPVVRKSRALTVGPCVLQLQWP